LLKDLDKLIEKQEYENTHVADRLERLNKMLNFRNEVAHYYKLTDQEVQVEEGLNNIS